MTPKQILEVIVRIEDAYDDPFDEDRKSRWKRALADQDPGAITRSLDRWLEQAEKFKAPTPHDLIRTAVIASPASTGATPQRTGYFATGVVRRGDGLPRGHLWTVYDEEITGVVFSDGGGWWLKPVEQVTAEDLATIRQSAPARERAA